MFFFGIIFYFTWQEITGPGTLMFFGHFILFGLVRYKLGQAHQFNLDILFYLGW